MTVVAAPKPISKRQADLIERLCAEQRICVLKFIADRFGRDRTLDSLTGGRDGEASVLIGELYTLRGARVEGDPAPGLYRLGQVVFRVRKAKSGTWYTQQVVKRGGRFSWKYTGHRMDVRGSERVDDDVAELFLKECGL